MAIGKKTGGGSRAGSPNKTTKDVREAMAVFCQSNVDQISEWLKEVDDPAKRIDLFLRALEYHVPKLARTEVSGVDGKAIAFDHTVSPQDAYMKMLGK